MIPLEQYPHSTVLQILQKMELRTWVQSRLTGPFIFDFVQENQQRFSFTCPIIDLLFNFGHFQEQCAIFLSYQKILITDPKVSMAGLRFEEIRFNEYGEQRLIYEGKDMAEIQAYRLNRCNIINNVVIPWVRLFKGRAQRIVLITGPVDIGLFLEASGCSFFVNHSDIGYGSTEFPAVLDRPQSQSVTGIKVFNLTQLRYVPQFIRRFEYFKARIFRIRGIFEEKSQEEVRDVLKILARGPPLPGPRSISIKRKFHSTYQEGIEFKYVNHRIVFNRMISYACPRNMSSNLLVALVEEQNFIGVISILSKPANEGCSYHAYYRMEILPTFDPERAAIFLLQRTVALHPMDVSGLFEDFTSGNDVGDIISKFLTACLIGP